MSYKQRLKGVNDRGADTGTVLLSAFLTWGRFRRSNLSKPFLVLIELNPPASLTSPFTA